MSDFTLTIGGEGVPGAGDFPVQNPARGRPFASAPTCSREQLDAAMGAAARAFMEWRTDEQARRKALAAGADLLEDAVSDLAPLLVSEQGKPRAEAEYELGRGVAWLRHFAGVEMPHEVLQDDAAARVEIVRRPIGVAAAITPWNFPVALACWKIAPALLAGNTVVLKPSPYTPLTTLRLGELFRSVFPPGVLNVVSGRDELGAWMCEHSVPRKISFTGSIATGKRVAAAAAPDLKRVTLELGGNDPAIVLDDVDPDAVAGQLVWAAFRNCGQVCSAIKRVYVPRRRYPAMVDALADHASALRVGDGSEDGVDMGPLNNSPQYARVQELVADAMSHGAQAATGGSARTGDGYFYEPTILAGIEDGVRIVDEEQFGPALPVVPYDDMEDVVRRANGTHFGLCASVWSTDHERAWEVADHVDAGTVWINTHLAIGPNIPFGGVKWSGIGVENGTAGLLSYTDLQVRHLARVEPQH